MKLVVWETKYVKQERNRGELVSEMHGGVHGKKREIEAKKNQTVTLREVRCMMENCMTQRRK